MFTSSYTNNSFMTYRPGVDEQNLFSLAGSHKQTLGRRKKRAGTYKYKYNGKELQDELGLNLYDYGARNYDAALGRWLSVDPLAEKYYGWSPYNYCLNNPVVHTDPDGRSVDNEYDFNVQTGKTTQVSNKGGDTTDYVNVVSNGKTLYTDVEKVQKTTVNVRTTSEIGHSFTQRLPGEIRTTNLKPMSGALGDPSASLMANYAGAKLAGVFIGAILSKASSFFVSEATTGAAEVTEASIAKALEGSTMKTIQGKVSLPMVERYVRRLESGSVAPTIKVADGVIIDGNHRYVAGRILGQEPSIVPGTLSASQASKVVPIQQTTVSPIDWGGH